MGASARPAQTIAAVAEAEQQQKELPAALGRAAAAHGRAAAAQGRAARPRACIFWGHGGGGGPRQDPEGGGGGGHSLGTQVLLPLSPEL